VTTGRNRALRPICVLLLAVLCGLGLAGSSGSVAHLGRSIVQAAGTATPVSAQPGLHVDADSAQRLAASGLVQQPAGPALPADLAAGLLLGAAAIFLGLARRSGAGRRSLHRAGTGPARAPPLAA
jgi:hypothetical protein